MQDPEDLYSILGVDADASQELIEEAYARLSQQYSTGSDDDRDRLDRAYQTLTDPQQREAYERSRVVQPASLGNLGAETVPGAWRPRPLNRDTMVEALVGNPRNLALLVVGIAALLGVGIWALVALPNWGGSDQLAVGNSAKGDTLVVAIFEIARVPEIRYMGTDQNHYLLAASGQDLELVALRLQVLNRESTQVIVNMDDKAAVLRGFNLEEEYPIVDAGVRSTRVEELHPEENRYVCPSGNQPDCWPFIAGAIALPLSYRLDGWIVFEVPRGMRLREMRWDAGDTIHIRS